MDGSGTELFYLFARESKSIFSSEGSNFYWLWLIFYLIVVFVISTHDLWRENRPLSVKNIWRASFPYEHFWSPQARLNYVLCFLFLILMKINLLPETQQLLINTYSKYTNGGFNQQTTKLILSEEVGLSIIFGIFLLLCEDTAYTIYHFFCHRWHFLWEFHKIHHVTSALNIFAATRTHPLDRMLEGVFTGAAILFGVHVGILLIGNLLNPVEIVNIGVFLWFRNVLTFQNLRHSHIWLSFGKVGYIFSSPAMHQIHHSLNPEHFGKNLSRYFSFLDKLLGTLYVPRKKENLTFGIPQEEWGDKRYDTVIGNLFHPLVPERFLRGRKQVSHNSQDQRLGATQRTE